MAGLGFSSKNCSISRANLAREVSVVGFRADMLVIIVGTFECASFDCPIAGQVVAREKIGSIIIALRADCCRVQRRVAVSTCSIQKQTEKCNTSI